MAYTVLPKQTEVVLNTLKSLPWMKPYYLAGGTALALQYNHRQSIDLDWFNQKDIQTTALIAELSELGDFELTQHEKNTVEGMLDEVKVSFMTYPYPLLEPVVLYEDSVPLAHPTDIALMKLGAIARRNTKKDFIDLYLFLQKNDMNLQELLRLTEKKFPKVKYDLVHLYKSLVYFTEADQEPMPNMITKIQWKEVKNFFEQEVKTAIKNK